MCFQQIVQIDFRHVGGRLVTTGVEIESVDSIAIVLGFDLFYEQSFAILCVVTFQRLNIVRVRFSAFSRMRSSNEIRVTLTRDAFDIDFAVVRWLLDLSLF